MMERVRGREVRDALTAVISEMLSMAPVLVEPSVATGHGDVERLSESVPGSDNGTSAPPLTEDKRFLPLPLQLPQRLLQRLAPQRPLVLPPRLDRDKLEAEDERRFRAERVRLRRAEDHHVGEGRRRVQAEEPLARGDAHGDDRLRSRALRQTVHCSAFTRERWSPKEATLRRKRVGRRTWITPAPTIPSLHQLWSSPSSLATQSVTFDSSSVQAGEQSQLKLRMRR